MIQCSIFVAIIELSMKVNGLMFVKNLLWCHLNLFSKAQMTKKEIKVAITWEPFGPRQTN